MTNKTPIYQLKDIQHYYGKKQVLDIKAFEISKGSITGLIGPNGSGKTTLLKLLAFAQKPTKGQILYHGKQEFPFSPFIRSKVTLLTQKPYLLKRTIFENIAYGLKIRKDTTNLDQRIAKALSYVGLDFEQFAQRMWHELSGGEAQRVAMAARLILKPDILLLDEPVANVDTKSAKLIRNASLRARNDWGTTLVIASHDLSWLFSVTDQQVSIFDGKLFSTGIENIIPGPFERLDNHRLIKKLENKQCIYLTASSLNSSMAVIQKKKTLLELTKKSDQPDLNQLWGYIVSMHLEKKHGLIMVQIAISGLTFELSLTFDQISREALFPGKKVIVSFKADDVEWI
ncbi:MAG: energy-coupling factor ABC transporter ATP-binding protein [Pseudomonadota bacterium]